MLKKLLLTVFLVAVLVLPAADIISKRNLELLENNNGGKNPPINIKKTVPDKKDVHNNLWVYKPNQNEIQIYSVLSDNNILLTKILKKDWGTWNIEGWFIALDGEMPTKQPYAIAAGDTDWEYVFRASLSSGQPARFSGGNHGNERLKSIRLVNAENNTEINLEVGDKYEMDKLKMIENTALITQENVSNKYADVERIYIFFPSKITLNSNFHFTRDIYMGTSYVCMMPVLKDYGQYIRFIDSGNIYTTPETGKTLTNKDFENYVGKEKTRTAEMWGNANPSYKFRVQIKNRDMVDYFNNDLKVFYWDLNKISNKLYFSKYNTDEYRKVSSGTVWNYSQSWELNVQKSNHPAVHHAE